MFDPVSHLIDGFLEAAGKSFVEAFPGAEAALLERLVSQGRLALETLATSDAAYHDLEHTLQVTLAGQAILRGRMQLEGDVQAADWLHFQLALMLHDIGYVRGALTDDRPGAYVIDADGGTFTPPPGATDASLTPWHVDRGMLLVRRRFSEDPLLDADRLCALIERTRFPVPDLPDHAITDDLPGLARAADLIGQLADPRLPQKQSKLWAEFRETGAAADLGHAHAGALRSAYPRFFWRVVSRYIDAGVRCLEATREGRSWVARLHEHVFAEEHGLWRNGPERGDLAQTVRLVR